MHGGAYSDVSMRDREYPAASICEMLASIGRACDRHQAAIRSIDEDKAGQPFGLSRHWDANVEGQLYASKRVLGVVVRRLVGRELTPYDFMGPGFR